MRNLKRVLSLALACVMVIGMMVMTTGAADLTDYDEITYTEAVDVAVALGLIEGNPDGSFNPDGILTREGAAKLICYMLMGPENAEKLVGTSNFTDVKATRWSAPYISYCVSLGYIAGNGDGTFNPTGKLTGVAFAKLLLCALGYDPVIEGYVNNKNYATNIGTDAIEAGINIDGVDMAAQLTREQAAQMILNTMTRTMVKYSTKGTSITVGGVDIVTGAAEAEAQKWVDEGYDYTTPGEGKVAGNDTETIQFCEKYFSGLKLTAGTADDFGRGADHGWALNNVEFYNELNTPKFVYTASTQASKIVTDLKGYTFLGTELESATTTFIGNEDATYDENLTIGDLTLNEEASDGGNDGDVIATVLAGLTANGKVVEIYVNPVTKAVTDVIAITSTVETIDNITTNPTTGDVTYDFSVTADKVDVADPEGTDTVMLHGTFAKGDVVTTVAGSNYLHVYPTTQFVGAQSAFDATTVTIGGNTYTVGTGVSDGTDAVAVADFGNSATAANYYLDQYGYVVYTDSINTTVVYTNYAQLKDAYLSKVTTTVDGSTPAVEARFVLADGTVAVYDLALAYTASNKEYKIAGTTVFDADNGSLDEKSEMDAVLDTLLAADTVFAYEIKDGKISLQPVDASDAAVLAVGDVVTDAPVSANIATGDTATTMSKETSGTVNTLLDKNTVYVLYDGVKKTSTTYVGALPAGASLEEATTTVIAVANSAALATAKVIFGLIDDVTVAPAASNEYAYVKTATYTTELQADGTTEYRIYTAVKADGTTVKVYGDSAGKFIADGSTVINAGLYTWNTDNEITATYAGSDVVGSQSYTVVGDQMVGADGAVYNMDDASVVYIGAGLTSVNGNNCIVVLAKAGVNVTNNAAAIFVISAP